MNYQEIVDKLEELEYYESEIAEMADDKGDLLEALEEHFGDVRLVHMQGGYEGEGDYAERVISFNDHGVFIRIIGFYSSWEGTTWDGGFQEVFPRRKMITVYETPEEKEDNLEDEKNDVSGN